jgi:hypothetical protein
MPKTQWPSPPAFEQLLIADQRCVASLSKITRGVSHLSSDLKDAWATSKVCGQVLSLPSQPFFAQINLHLCVCLLVSGSACLKPFSCATCRQHRSGDSGSTFLCSSSAARTFWTMPSCSAWRRWSALSSAAGTRRQKPTPAERFAVLNQCVAF